MNAEQLEQKSRLQQKQNQARTGKTAGSNKKANQPEKPDISLVEFFLMTFIALIGDCLAIFGSPCLIILALWYKWRFDKWPIGRSGIFGVFELITAGIAPCLLLFMGQTAMEYLGLGLLTPLIKK